MQTPCSLNPQVAIDSWAQADSTFLLCVNDLSLSKSRLNLEKHLTATGKPLHGEPGKLQYLPVEAVEMLRRGGAALALALGV